MEKIIIATTTDPSYEIAFDVYESVTHTKKTYPITIEGAGRALFNINNDPVYLIISSEEINDNGTIKLKRDVLARINGKASFDQIRALYIKALNGDLNTDGELIINGDSGGFNDNDSLFNGFGFGVDLPAWAWLIPLAVGTYKTTFTKSKIKPIWGGIAALSAYKYFNK